MARIDIFLLNKLNDLIIENKINLEDLKKVIFINYRTENQEEKNLCTSILIRINETTKIENIDKDLQLNNFINNKTYNILYTGEFND